MEQKCTPKELIEKLNKITKENGYGNIINISTETGAYIFSYTEANSKAKF